MRPSFPSAAIAGLLLAMAPGGAVRAESYTLIIHETPAELARRSDPVDGPAYWRAYAEYSEAMRAAGVLRGGAALAVDARVSRVYRDRPCVGTSAPVTAPAAAPKPSACATGEASGSGAGPETSPIGGYFVIEADRLETAQAWAARAPTRGGVDVYPAYPAPAMPPASRPER